MSYIVNENSCTSNGSEVLICIKNVFFDSLQMGFQVEELKCEIRKQKWWDKKENGKCSSYFFKS